MPERRRFGRLAGHVVAAAAPSGDVGHLADSATTAEPLPPLETNRLTATIGVEVGGIDLSKPLSPQQLAQIDLALQEHKVLVFRGQRSVQAEQQHAFVKAMNNQWGLAPVSDQQKFDYEDGAFVIKMFSSKKGQRNVWQVNSIDAAREVRGSVGSEKPEYFTPKVSYDAISAPTRKPTWPFASILGRRGPRADAPGAKYFELFNSPGQWMRYGHERTQAANSFHSDDQYTIEPPWAVTIHAMRLPSVGGDTVFADMTQAYDDLDDATQARLRKMSVVVTFDNAFPNHKALAEASGDWESYKELRSHYPSVAHPLIRTHPQTGRQTVYANRNYAHRLLGPAGEELEDGGADLMRELFCLSTVPEYQLRLNWKSPGDLTMYDNRAVQHYGVADYGLLPEGEQSRMLEHIACLGTRPYHRDEDGSIRESRFIGD